MMTTQMTTALTDFSATATASELHRLVILLNLAEGAWALAIYEDGAVRRQVIADLRPALAPLALVEISLAGNSANVLDHMQQAAQTARQPAPVVSFNDVSHAFPALFGHLDVQRETLARAPHRLLFWLSEGERRELAHSAPNFYSRLSGVFRFPGRVGPQAMVLSNPPLRVTPGESSGAGARRRPRVPVVDERDRQQIIARQKSRLDALRGRPRPDWKAVGDAWYDMAGLHEEEMPRRWDVAAASYAEAARAYTNAGQTAWQAEALFQAADAARRVYATEASLDYAQNSLALYRLLSDGSSTPQTILLGEANTLKVIGDVQQFRADREGALASYGQALDLFRQVGDRLGEANVLRAIGDAQQFRKEIEGALASYRQALELYRQVGDRLGEANALRAIGDAQQFRKEIEGALASYRQALDLYRQVGARLGEANTLQVIGNLSRTAQQYEEAKSLYDNSLTLYQAIGERQGEANSYLELARLALVQGNARPAQQYAQQAIERHTANGDRYGAALDHETLAAACRAANEPAAAMDAMQQAAALYTEIGLTGKAASVGSALADLLAEQDRLEEALAVSATTVES
ncbi:MAG: tetratricopeptide repeat protein, partial [Anaerolineae bacterium]